MRIGLIARYDNSGLGTLSWEFARYLKPDKVLLVQNQKFHLFPERYEEFDVKKCLPYSGPKEGDMRWLLEDIDVVLSIETFYNWDVIQKAKEKGVKTALVTMCEMMPVSLPVNPDLCLCPSILDYEQMPEPKVHIPIPVNTEVLKYKKREKAKVFVHPASHGGSFERKGTTALIEAMDYVKSDIKLIIYSWKNYQIKNPKIELKVQNFKNYWQVWEEGDVLVYPQNCNGICLPLIEAMASGLAVITTDIYPFNKYMHKDLLFGYTEMRKEALSAGLREMEVARIDPKKIAEKIDEIAHKDITKYSEYGRDWAKKNSWEVLGLQYKKALEKLCNTP